MNKSLNELQNLAQETRRNIVEMIYKAGTGHPAGSLSSVEIFVALYSEVMKFDPKNPNLENRDRLFVSAGHICPAQYSVMAEVGYFDKSLLSTYAKLGSVLQGHPERVKLPGIENTSGPLGLGLAQSVGYALSAKMDNKDFRIFCICSDAEHDEGNHWEAVLLGAKYQLSNLTLFVDRNMIQIESGTEQTLPLGDLGEKYRAFGWNVLEINGHDFNEIISATNSAKEFKNGPIVIIAQTVAGKGVSFMERDPSWHSKSPTEEEYKRAMEELNV